MFCSSGKKLLSFLYASYIWVDIFYIIFLEKSTGSGLKIKKRHENTTFFNEN